MGRLLLTVNLDLPINSINTIREESWRIFQIQQSKMAHITKTKQISAVHNFIDVGADYFPAVFHVKHPYFFISILSKNTCTWNGETIIDNQI